MALTSKGREGVLLVVNVVRRVQPVVEGLDVVQAPVRPVDAKLDDGHVRHKLRHIVQGAHFPQLAVATRASPARPAIPRTLGAGSRAE